MMKQKSARNGVVFFFILHSAFRLFKNGVKSAKEK